MSDVKIQKLIDSVNKKKEEIKNISAYSYKTNCAYIEDGKTINLQVLDINAIAMKLAFLRRCSDDLAEIEKELGIKILKQIGNYSMADWDSDMCYIIKKKGLEQKRKELSDLENKLNKLVSPELKRQIELEAIEKELESM